MGTWQNILPYLFVTIVATLACSGVDIYAEMKKFYEKYYTSDRICVCIVSSGDGGRLQDLEKIAIDTFGKIKEKRAEKLLPLYRSLDASSYPPIANKNLPFVLR